MTPTLRQRLTAALDGSPLAERLPIASESLVELRSEDAAVEELEGLVAAGLARLIASQQQSAGFLSHRPELLARIVRANADTLAERAEELEGTPLEATGDLEDDLDALRVLRNEETCLTACLDLGGVVPFAEASYFLSVLAESITRAAFALAQQADRDGTSAEFAVIGMGKVAGREFTYHSDLDLIFLYGGPPENLSQVSRIGQRLISYLSTMTGAGIAYPVDMRLRPSGGQGVLVTSFAGFERYQLERAETWEHMALLRARAIAGHAEAAQQALDRIREQVLVRDIQPWSYIADLRGRVERERSKTSEESVSLKTGVGGLMDVDFLASGALLELGASALPELPSVPDMLVAAVTGSRVDQLVADYRFLRRVESRARWLAGRGVDTVPTAGEELCVLAELVEPGGDPGALAHQLTDARSRIRAAFQDVVDAGTIHAICD